MNIKEFKKRLTDRPLKFPSNNKKSFGVIESLLSAFIFWSPNCLLLFPFFKNFVFIFLLYNYFALFLLSSAISNLKFKT